MHSKISIILINEGEATLLPTWRKYTGGEAMKGMNKRGVKEREKAPLSD